MAKTVYIEHDGAFFRGFSTGHPQEVWHGADKGWVPYRFEGPHKPVDWGSEITEEEFKRLAALDELGPSARPLAS